MYIVITRVVSDAYPEVNIQSIVAVGADAAWLHSQVKLRLEADEVPYNFFKAGTLNGIDGDAIAMSRRSEVETLVAIAKVPSEDGIFLSDIGWSQMEMYSIFVVHSQAIVG